MDGINVDLFFKLFLQCVADVLGEFLHIFQSIVGTFRAVQDYPSPNASSKECNLPRRVSFSRLSATPNICLKSRWSLIISSVSITDRSWPTISSKYFLSNT